MSLAFAPYVQDFLGTRRPSGPVPPSLERPSSGSFSLSSATSFWLVTRYFGLVRFPFNFLFRIANPKVRTRNVFGFHTDISPFIHSSSNAFCVHTDSPVFIHSSSTDQECFLRFARLRGLSFSHQLHHLSVSTDHFSFWQFAFNLFIPNRKPEGKDPECLLRSHRIFLSLFEAAPQTKNAPCVSPL